MRRRGRFLVLCLLLVLLPLRGLLAAVHLGCEQAPLQREHIAHAHHNGHGEAHGAAAKPCKLRAPCCLTAAPPPVLTTGTTSTTAAAPAEAWAQRRAADARPASAALSRSPRCPAVRADRRLAFVLPR